MLEATEAEAPWAGARRGGLVSVVVPVYCEEQTIDELYTRLSLVLDGLAPEYAGEMILVNDGSEDASLDLLLALAARDRRVRVIDLARNFGHQLAITAGLDHASGDAVVLIDGDLQDPPEVIPEMVARWRAGADVVYGQRQRRSGEGRFKRATAKAFYRLMNWLSDVRMPVDTGDFRLLDRAVVDVLMGMREENRYLRGMVAWVGFRQEALSYERDSRFAGTSKYTLGKMLRLALDGLASFSSRPLVLSAQMGAAVTLAAFLFLLWIIVNKIVDPAATVQGWASVLVAVLFLGGVQLLSIGILGVYLGRVFGETKGRPLYVIAHRIGFGDSGAAAGGRDPQATVAVDGACAEPADDA
jgi:glycosyltransferase involved in cell wall biosynthesis